MLPLPPAVIARVNVLGEAEPSILTFTDRHGREIGDYPQEDPVADEDDSVVAYDYFDEPQANSEITGVDNVPSTEPTGVEMEDPQDVPQATNADSQDGLE